MSTPRYELHYPSLDELKSGHNQYLKHGGVFLTEKNAPPPLSEVSVVVRLPDDTTAELVARVVNIIAAGFFVQFLVQDQVTELNTNIEALINAPPTARPPESDTVNNPSQVANSGDDQPGLAPPLSGPMQNVWQLIDMGSGVPLGQQVRALSVADRIRLARHANRPIRALLIRDSEKRIHVEVVKNPKTTDDEIVDWSSLSGISPLALKWMSTQKRLMRKRQLQLNLVKNPMTPQNIAIKLVKHLHITDCRKIAKSSQVREAIARIARKRVAEAVAKM